MKDFQYYMTNPVPVMNPDDHKTAHVYKGGKVLFSGPYLTFENQRSEYPKDALVEVVFDPESADAARDAHHESRRRLIEEFKNDLGEKFEIVEPAVLDKMFEAANKMTANEPHIERRLRQIYAQFQSLADVYRTFKTTYETRT